MQMENDTNLQTI